MTYLSLNKHLGNSNSHQTFEMLTCFAAASSSLPSPTTTYVHFLPNRDTIRSKQLSFPATKYPITNTSQLHFTTLPCHSVIDWWFDCFIPSSKIFHLNVDLLEHGHVVLMMLISESIFCSVFIFQYSYSKSQKELLMLVPDKNSTTIIHYCGF